MALASRCWGSAQAAAADSRLEGSQLASGEVDLSTWPDALSLHSGGIRGQLTSQEWQLLLGKLERLPKTNFPHTHCFSWRAER